METSDEQSAQSKSKLTPEERAWNVIEENIYNVPTNGQLKRLIAAAIREAVADERTRYIEALCFYAEPAVYFPTRSGDTEPIWVDTDGTRFNADDEYDAPGAMARALLKEVAPEARSVFGVLSGSVTPTP